MKQNQTIKTAANILWNDCGKENKHKWQFQSSSPESYSNKEWGQTFNRKEVALNQK